jgi:lipoyl(octanoyl) transferase
MNVARILRWNYLGSVPYERAMALQLRLRDELARGEVVDHLLLLEHPHVFTLGRSAADDDVLVDRYWLKSHDVEMFETDRGGQVTYHGPGQLVGYPIVDLSPDRRDIRRYVRDLQEVLVRTLGDFGVTAEGAGEQALIGVWAEQRKVASIGVHLSRWITTHGFALNVTTDLSFFQRIVPCGLPEARMASIESLTGARPDLSEVAATVARHFGDVFERELEQVEAATLNV